MLLVVNPIINFVTYEKLKKDLMTRGWAMTAAQLFLVSSISKTLATFGTYPILTVRVKLQDEKIKNQQVSLFKFVMGLLQQVGIKGLYSGVFAKLF